MKHNKSIVKIVDDDAEAIKIALEALKQIYFYTKSQHIKNICKDAIHEIAEKVTTHD